MYNKQVLAFEMNALFFNTYCIPPSSNEHIAGIVNYISQRVYYDDDLDVIALAEVFNNSRGLFTKLIKTNERLKDFDIYEKRGSSSMLDNGLMMLVRNCVATNEFFTPFKRSYSIDALSEKGFLTLKIDKVCETGRSGYVLAVTHLQNAEVLFCTQKGTAVVADQLRQLMNHVLILSKTTGRIPIVLGDFNIEPSRLVDILPPFHNDFKIVAPFFGTTKD
ncbi:MAG: hypothetical protein CL916_03675, partial [Deltaproteobacteria bacterium]|nr:hypothetical protein [Deltaproteobacteria bacterium]